MSALSPAALWGQAVRERPGGMHSARYRVLMSEHGHLIPGRPEPLPCGYDPVTVARKRPAEAVYFGCWQQAGHFHWLPGMQKVNRITETAPITPWGSSIDGAIIPRLERSGPEGVAYLQHLAGWTALAMCDRTVDHRGASHSTFAFRAHLTFEQAVLAARDYFPKVVERFTFEIVEAS